MPKCWRCGKFRIFFRLSSAGLCMSCLEEAADEAIHIIEKLKESRSERKKFCDALDKMEENASIEKLGPLFQSSPFSVWDISVHLAEGQYDRIVRSESVKLISYDTKSQSAQAEGSKGVIYTTTFKSCTCGDFIARRLPCKHMYKLAAEYGEVDLSPIYRRG